tara:strand:+ start:399 stop:1562 length:1164 start_codon:yes stop_codon:yes gene_type:complete
MSIFRQHKTIADRSAGDRARHRKKIEKAIKDGIHNIVAEESIIGKNGKKKFRIPVRGIKEYRFVYGDNGSKRVGSAQGKDVSRGQTIGKKEKKKGKPGEKPGNQAGEEFYEVELTLEQLADYLFNDLELPNFEKKKDSQVVSKKIKRKGYRTKGIRPRLDKKKTVIQKIKRQKKAEYSGSYEKDSDDNFSFHERDLRYKHYKLTEKRTSNAVIFFLMDISGSMTTDKKFLARSFFFLLYHFIRTKYDKVDIVFLSHDIEAYEVDEDQFFGRGSAGGTMVSSVLKKTEQIIDERYHQQSWNTYVFQCSDGDNWPGDNKATKAYVESILPKSQFFGYCEIEPSQERLKWMKETSLSKIYETIYSDKFKSVGIYQKEDIWVAFRNFFGGV